MKKNKTQLIPELQELRQKVADLERAKSSHGREVMHQNVLNSITDAVISVDSEMNILYWNPGAEKMFGFKAKEIIGQSLMKIVPEKFKKAKESGFGKFQKTGEGPALGKTLELEGRKKDGTIFPLELSVSSSKSCDRFIATAVIRDIAERKDEAARLARKTYELTERIKELNCLYELENICRTEKTLI